MRANIKKLLLSNEAIITLAVVAVSAVIGSLNPAFFSFATLFDIIRSALPSCLMGLGILSVLIAGEVDISFVSIAAMSSFSTHMLLLHFGYKGGITLYLVIAIIIGIAAGLLVGVIATQFKLPVFPVSLGFWLLWYGFNLFFISPVMNFNLPTGLVGYYARFLIKIHDPFVGWTGLHVSVLYLAVIAVFIWWLLRYTVFGRGLYAMGGNREVARRTGYNINFILWMALMLDGALAAIAGVVQSAYSRFFNPILFRGQELYVIAAAVIGGVSITGGRGSVLGVILGVIFVQIITRGLIYLGIPAKWQQLVLGGILILFVAISAIRTMESGKSLFSKVKSKK